MARTAPGMKVAGLSCRLLHGTWEPVVPMPRETRNRRPRERLSTDAGHRGGRARSSDEGPVMGLERRGPALLPRTAANQQWEEPVSDARPRVETTRRWSTGNGRNCCPRSVAGGQEPYDGRLSRTVLRAPRGEIPRGDSTSLHTAQAGCSVSIFSTFSARPWRAGHTPGRGTPLRMDSFETGSTASKSTRPVTCRHPTPSAQKTTIPNECPPAFHPPG